MNRCDVVETKLLDFKGSSAKAMGTVLRCKKCPHTFPVKGVLESMTKAEKTSFINKVSNNLSKHDCEGEKKEAAAGPAPEAAAARAPLEREAEEDARPACGGGPVVADGEDDAPRNVEQP